VPTDRATALRHAFEETMKDAGFLAEASRSHAEIIPVSAAALQALLTDAYATPRHIVARARQVVN
jgi:hypothetical protein